MIRKKFLTCSILFVCGAFLICFSLGTHFFGNFILKQKVIENLILKQESPTLNYWSNPPAKIYRKYYLFNVTNSFEVAKKNKKPILDELGPYVYREEAIKTDIKFLSSDNNNKFSYKPVSTLYFEPNMSNGSEHDIIHFLNLPLVGMFDNVNNYLKKYPIFIKTLLNGYELFEKKTVHDLISGYTHPILKLANTFGLSKTSQFSISDSNGTAIREYVVTNGQDNIENIGQIETWNGLTTLDYYETEQANAINGSDGSSFPPFLNRNQTVYMFNPDLCRSLKLEYLKDNRVDGIQTYDFHLPKNIFNNTAKKDFFKNEKDFIGDGVFGINKCRNDSRIAVSLPHFLNADKKFLDGVVGLKPNESRHDYVLSIEPNTGSAIGVNVRVQINYDLKRNEKYRLFESIKSVLLPIFWIESEVKTDPLITDNLKTLNLAIFLMYLIPFIALCLGSVMLISSIIIFLIIFKNKSFKDKYNLSEVSIISYEQSASNEKY